MSKENSELKKRITIAMPHKSYEKLVSIQKATGQVSETETVRAALALYFSLYKECCDGNKICLIGPDGETIRYHVSSFAYIC